MRKLHHAESCRGADRNAKTAVAPPTIYTSTRRRGAGGGGGMDGRERKGSGGEGERPVQGSGVWV